MKVLLVILLVSLMVVSGQRIYPAGVNFMMRDILIDKFRDIIIPDIMEKFKVIKPDDIEHKHSLYEIRIYNMEADIVPLRGDQVQIITSDADNSLYAKVVDFEMEFHADAYGRALFIHAHGDARIHVKIDEFSFKVEPKIKADGDLNKLDYWVDSIKVDIHSGDIHLEHLSIGFLPSWLLTPIGNLILNSCAAAYHAFEGMIDKEIVVILDSHRADIPDNIDLSPTGYPLTMSLSFPNVPHLFNDRVEVPFDGTIFLTSEGYHPQDDPAPPMPSFNPDDQNNIQVFVNQHVLKTTLAAAKKAGLTFEVNSDTLKPLGLADDLMKVEYLSMLFPRLACHYDSGSAMRILVGVDPDLNSEVDFSQDKVHGEFSPFLRFMVGDEVAFTIGIRAVFDATVHFQAQAKQAFVTANLDNIDLAEFKFTPAKMEETDLWDIVTKFKPTVIPIVMDTANKILNPGLSIPVFVLIKDIFEVDLEDILIQMKDKYLEASFTLDIHQRLELVKQLLKLYSA
uniref:Uncharacterized protein n=1 Tax=Euplotes harpa TaxID=151035 RepID=A0A7S3J626_9SPIT|mmetsp:Transcript_17141/g.19784  ORF Transcript_17141/g.19784 Transcript_17141/m.19784 type:complete len:510 (+) Transcript_17141:12-1541(+)